MKDELKPCPFCGGDPMIRERYIHNVANKKNYKIECKDCTNTFSNWYKSLKKAIEVWNNRSDSK